jgi:hypothetical protein
VVVNFFIFGLAPNLMGCGTFNIVDAQVGDVLIDIQLNDDFRSRFINIVISIIISFSGYNWFLNELGPGP